jgi:hypothetical protein
MFLFESNTTIELYNFNIHAELKPVNTAEQAPCLTSSVAKLFTKLNFGQGKPKHPRIQTHQHAGNFSVMSRETLTAPIEPIRLIWIN